MFCLNWLTLYFFVSGKILFLQYFSCKPKFGVFIRKSRANLLPSNNKSDEKSTKNNESNLVVCLSWKGMRFFYAVHDHVVVRCRGSFVPSCSYLIWRLSILCSISKCLFEGCMCLCSNTQPTDMLAFRWECGAILYYTPMRSTKLGRFASSEVSKSVKHNVFPTSVKCLNTFIG